MGDDTILYKAISVASGKGLDIEEGINRLQVDWAEAGQ